MLARRRSRGGRTWRTARTGRPPPRTSAGPGPAPRVRRRSREVAASSVGYDVLDDVTRGGSTSPRGAGRGRTLIPRPPRPRPRPPRRPPRRRARRTGSSASVGLFERALDLERRRRRRPMPAMRAAAPTRARPALMPSATIDSSSNQPAIGSCPARRPRRCRTSSDHLTRPRRRRGCRRRRPVQSSTDEWSALPFSLPRWLRLRAARAVVGPGLRGWRKASAASSSAASAAPRMAARAQFSVSISRCDTDSTTELDCEAGIPSVLPLAYLAIDA